MTIKSLTYDLYQNELAKIRRAVIESKRMTHNQISVIVALIPYLECVCGGDGVVDLQYCRHGGDCDCNAQIANCHCMADDRIQGIALCECCGEVSAEAVGEGYTAHCKRCGDEFEAAENVPADIEPWWGATTPTPELVEKMDKLAAEFMSKFFAAGPGDFAWEDECHLNYCPNCGPDCEE